MNHAYWYYGLIIISLVLLIGSILLKKDLKLLAFSFILTGIIHPAEVFILFIIPGYRYIPHMLPNIWFDNVAGAIVSDLFVLPTAGVVINAFSFSWGSIIGFSAVFAGIDYLFVHLDIYEHYWWNSLYTSIVFITLIAISKWIWKRVKQDDQPLLFKLAMVYLIISSILTVISFFSNEILNLYQFQIGWLQEPMREHLLVSSTYLYLVSIVVTLSLGLRLSTSSRVIIILLLTAFNWLLGYYGILMQLSVFPPVCYTLVQVLSAIILIYILRITHMKDYFKDI